MINSYPESSPTPSHLPKPRMRNIFFSKQRFIFFNCGLPSDISSEPTPIIYLVDNPRCISIGSTPTIDILYGLPSDNYQLGQLRRLIFYMDYPPIIIIISQPSEITLSMNHLMHSLLSFYVPQCIWKCMMSIPLQLYNICKYIIMHIFT